MRFSVTQVAEVAAHWSVANHIPDTASGFSATLFESKDNPDEVVLACRGTAGFDDVVLTDGGDIVLDGIAIDQVVDLYNYWKSLTTQGSYMAARLVTLQAETQALTDAYLISSEAGAQLEAQYRGQGFIIDHGDGSLVRTIEFGSSDNLLAGTDLATGSGAGIGKTLTFVTGHSLGGHLVAAFTRLFPEAGVDALAVNGAGFASNSNVDNLFALLGGVAAFDASRLLNVYGSAGPQVVAQDWYLQQQGGFEEIYTESAGPSTVFGHGKEQMTDSLAVYDVFFHMDGALQSVSLSEALGALRPLFEVAAPEAKRTLESLAGSLGRLFGVLTDDPKASDRDALYVSLKAIRERADINRDGNGIGLYKIESLVEKTTNDLILAATNPDPTNTSAIAYRYALKALNPFAAMGADYSPHNAHGELDRYDPGTHEGNLTQQSIEDRAVFLVKLVQINIADQAAVTGVPDTYTIQGSTTYVDQQRGLTLQGDFHGTKEYIKFGADQGDSLLGGGQADRLYGLGGTDYLEGKGGDDYLEGGAGLDVYQYTASEAGINSNDGADTILDTDGRGLLRYSYDPGLLSAETHSVIADASLKLSDTQWQSADGRFTYTKQGTDLLVTLNDAAGGSLLLKDWRKGDFGIHPGGELAGARVPAANLINGTEFSDDGSIQGGITHSSLIGTIGADEIHGLGGNDWLEGREGEDRLYGEAGRDKLYGGLGGDTAVGGTGDDIVLPIDGNDVAVGEELINGDLLATMRAAIQSDAIAPGVMRDFLGGGGGDDIVVGSAGKDLISGGRGTDTLIGGAGADLIFGDSELVTDRFDWDFGDQIPGFFLNIGGVFAAIEDGEADTIYGGGGDDIVRAEGGDDVINGGAGNDVLIGHEGDDLIVGGEGNDQLIGDRFSDDPEVPAGITAPAGDDYLDGGAGNDELQGGGGNDILIGGGDNDTLFGGEGEDWLFGGPGLDALVGGAGRDTYVFSKGDGTDTVFDTPPQDLTNLAERSVVVVLDERIKKEDVKFRTGSLMIDFGLSDPNDPNSAHDAIHFEGFNALYPWATPVVGEIRFAAGSVMTYDDILAQGFDIDGTEFDDNGPPGSLHAALSGTAVTDRMRGLGGNDILAGLQGDDTLDGGAGSDELQGGEANDTLDGGAGADLLRGDAGADTLIGGDGDDVLWGDHFLDPPADQGDDVLFGDAGNDQLLGHGGNDALDGGDGDDRLDGGDGADTLVGGAGDDQLFGGEGGDTYVFSAGHGADTLTEYGDAAVSLDTVEFTQEIEPDSIRVRRDRNDLTLSAASGADSVRVADYFSPFLTGVGIERVRFVDGALWDAAALRERLTTGSDAGDTIVGTEGTDVLRGFAGNDILDGAGGDDRLEGGVGTDTYVLGWVDGHDTVIDDPRERSIVQLSEGMLFDDLGMTRLGDDLHLTVLDTTSELVFPGYYALSSNWSVRNAAGEQQVLADVLAAIAARAAVATADQAKQAFIDSARRRYLAELASFGGSGNISVHSRGSDDASIYRQSSQFAGSPPYYLLPIESVTGGTSDNFFDLYYSGVMAVDGGAGNDFVYAYGWGAEGIGSFLYGNAGDDTIVGTFDSDVLNGGDGLDYLSGGQGDDTYLVFSDTDGVDIIDESVLAYLPRGNDAGGAGVYSSDTLAFGPGIALSDLQLSWGHVDPAQFANGEFDRNRIYSTLDIRWGAAGVVRVVLPDPDYRLAYPTYGGGAFSPEYGIEFVRFADGMCIAFGELLARAPPEPVIAQNTDNLVTGTGGNDVLYGYDGDDVLRGLDGDDALFGGDGFDVLNGGAGNDYLADSNVALLDTRNNLFLGGAGEDVVDIAMQSRQLGHADIVNFVIGGAGQDLVRSAPSSHWILGFNRFDGVDTVWQSLGAYGSEVISLGGGIGAGDVTAQRIGPDLFLEVGQGEGIWLRGWNNWNSNELRLQIIGNDIRVYDLSAFAAHGGTIENYLLSTSTDQALGGGIAYAYATRGNVETSGEAITTVLSALEFWRQAQPIVLPRVITGTQDSDYLEGGPGNETIRGLGGNDSLVGLAGDDVLDGGAGNDWSSGGDGNDTYLFGSGYGQDNIGEFISEIGGFDRIQLSDLTPAQVTVARVMLESGGVGLGLFDESFYLLVNGTQDWLRFYAGASAVESIEFSDGTLWDEAALRARVQVPAATAFADLIGGSTGNDSIAALDGNDQLHGNEGDDILSGEGGDDSIEGGRGSDLLFGGEGNDDLEDFLGSSFLDGGVGDDYLYSEGGPVLAVGGVGDDYLDLYAADLAIAAFNAGHGQDTLWLSGSTVFSLGSDVSVDALALRMQGNGLVFETSATDSVQINPDWSVQAVPGLTLQTFGEVRFGDLVRSYDFSAVIAEFAARRLQDPSLARWHFGDGLSDYLLTESADLALGGNLAYQYANYGDLAGLGAESMRAMLNDIDFGFAAQAFSTAGRVFEARVGGSMLTGGPGDDTYLVGLGSGVTTIVDKASASAPNQLIFGPAITPDMLTLDVGSLLIHVGEGGDVVHLAAFEPNDVYSSRTVERFRFENGATLSYEQLLQRGFDIYGTGGADFLTGTALTDRIGGGAGDDTFQGFGGDDVLSGGAGKDLYRFGRGDGRDRIIESGLAGEIDAVVMADDLTPGEITLADDGANLILGMAGSADTLIIENWLDPAGQVEEIRYADGTVWGEATLLRVFNRPPAYTGTLANQAALEDYPFSYTVSTEAFFDPDPDDMLVFEAAGNGGALPVWLNFDGETRTFSGTPENADVGDLAISVTAVDSKGLAASGNFLLMVSNTNDAPVANFWLDSVRTPEDQLFAITLPAGLFADEDPADALSLAVGLADAAGLPDWLRFDAATSRLIGTPGNADVGTYLLSVTATDLSGAQVRVPLELTVDNVNDAPFAVSASVRAAIVEGRISVIDLPQPLFLDVDAGDRLAYSAQLQGGATLPAWLGFDAAQLRLVATPGSNDQGDYAIEIETRDLAGESAVSRLALEVINVNTVYGTDAPDEITLDRDFDIVFANNGEDVVRAGAGDDVAFGENGNDRLEGEAGNDWLVGGRGDDTLSGGDGHDALMGDEGNDVIVGTAARSFMAGGKGGDTLQLGDRASVVAINEKEGIDRLTGYGELTTLSFGSGIAPAALSLQRSGDDLLVETGAGSALVLAGWYGGTPRGAMQLQCIGATIEGSGGEQVKVFDFDSWAADYDRAQAVGEAFDATASLNAHLLWTSATHAIGGELAYRYATKGGLSDLTPEQVQSGLGSAEFAAAPQRFAASTDLGNGFATEAPAVLTGPQLPSNEASAPHARPNKSAPVGVPAEYAPAVPSENAATVAANNIVTPSAASAYAAWFAQTAKQNPFEHAVESAQAAFHAPELAPDDDAAWLQRRWAAVHRWLEGDMALADDLGAPAGFSAARIGLALPHRHEALGVQWSALDASAAANGLKPFEGLSEGFAKLG